MKKLFAGLLALVMAFALIGCGSKEETKKTEEKADSVKIGLICLHDENSTYDNNFIQALYEVQKDLGLSNDQVLVKTNIGEDEACYSAAAELVDEGCDIIFADSFGHEDFIVQAAEEFPDVQFCHATGTKAKQLKLDNFHNAFASIYEGRYLAGIAAGMKLNEMIEKGDITADGAKIGYVGAFDYAEVVSGMTSFFLGARSVCESATMKVTYTNSWFDIALEREAALSLIKDGCVLISQHADSEGAPKACEEKNVPNVAYNISTISMAPNTALISSKIDWAPYFKLIIESVEKGEAIPTDYCGTIESGSIKLTELNEKVAAKGTQEAIDEAMAKIKSGDLKVFDTKTFTKDGKELTEYLADVDGDFKGETNVITDGYFDESGDNFRSAPYFDIKYIDGISAK
ncbi:MAG: BMP family ABC transporter substrate-binding protein [Acutalibacteraceae bacterium]